MLKYLKQRHAKHYKGKPFHLFADIFFLVIIIALIITFFVIYNWKAPSLVDVSISGPSQITSGANNDFVLKYHANSPTKNNVLNLNLPDNFTISGVEPNGAYDAKNNSLKIGNLHAGQSGEFKIHTLTVGAMDHADQFFSSLNCDECGTGILSYFNYTINNSALSVDMQVPNKTYDKIEFNGKLIIKNNGAANFDAVKIIIDKQLSLKSLDANINNNVLIIKNLGAGQSQEINFSAISSSGIGSKNINLTSYLTLNDEDLKQLSENIPLNVAQSNFKVSVNTDQSVAKNGDAIKYTINFQNQEKAPISNIKFDLFSGQDNYTINSVKLINPDSSVKLSGNNLTVNGILNPNEAKKIDIQVNYKRINPGTEIELALDTAVSYKISEQALKYHLISDKTKILSNIKASAVVRYYSLQGDQLGVGPIPPTVDMATKYWVFLEISNLGNDLDNIIVNADVPSSAIWTDNKSLLAGALNYDSATGRASWQTDSVAKDGSGVYRVAFELGVIPETSDIGKPITLLKNIRFSAHDKFCDQVIYGNLNDLNTKISDSHFGTNNGLVVAGE